MQTFEEWNAMQCRDSLPPVAWDFDGHARKAWEAALQAAQKAGLLQEAPNQ